MSGLFWMHSYGAYVVLLQQDFDWSKTLVAGAFALTRLESGFLGPLQGWLTDKYGPRIVLAIGNFLFGIGFILFAFVDSVLTFYAVSVLIALGASLGGFATLMVAIVHWFHRHRAKAVAGAQLGFSLGGIAVPLLILMLELFGWRTTAFLSGVLILVVTMPLGIGIRHRPEQHGLLPDGHLDLPISDDPREHAEVARFNAMEAMRTKSFWFLTLGHTCALLSIATISVHLIPHLNQGLGYSLTKAGLIVTLITIFQLIGQLVGGYLGDRFEKRFLCALCLFGHAVAMFVVVLTESFTWIVFFAVVQGLAWGIRAPLIISIRAEYFGPRFFGTILGFSSLILMVGMSVGPIVTGFMADTLGNYVLGFCAMGAMCFVGAILFIFATKPETNNSPEAIKRRWQYARRKLERKRFASNR